MLTWRSDETAEGARQRIGRVELAGRDVPVALWTPTNQPGPVPLVLIGHGGGGHKQDDSRLDLAARYNERRCAVAAIDGPWHGEREAVRGRYTDAVIDAMVADWRLTLDALAGLPEIDANRIGYGGVSMGTLFGLPLLAAEPRVGAAVLGLCGLRSSDGARIDAAGRLERDAARTGYRLLFLVQWDDDLFDRDSTLELFDRLAASDKTLLASPGRHHERPLRVRAQGVDFLVARSDEGWAPVPQNIEVKARAGDLDAIAARARSLGAEHVATLHQRDVFFAVTEGYLKLRTIDSAPGGEVICYRRDRDRSLRPSAYEIEPVAAAAAESALRAEHRVRGIVLKRRTLLVWRHTRIHLDEVDGLGFFVEVETVVDGIGADAATAEAQQVIEALGLDAASFEAAPYLELLETAGSP